jgi:hypothetical protein
LIAARCALVGACASAAVATEADSNIARIAARLNVLIMGPLLAAAACAAAASEDVE